MYGIDIPQQKIVEFCQRWKVVEFALFGSILPEDFRPDSDVDVLVTFAPDATWTLSDHIDMPDELKKPLWAEGRTCEPSRD